MWQTLEAITNVNQVNVSRDERLFSIIGGGFLLLIALIRIPLTAVLALVVAVYLFFRGIRGYCYIYDQLGQNTAVPAPRLERQENGETAVATPSYLPEPK